MYYSKSWKWYCLVLLTILPVDTHSIAVGEKNPTLVKKRLSTYKDGLFILNF